MPPRRLSRVQAIHEIWRSIPTEKERGEAIVPMVTGLSSIEWQKLLVCGSIARRPGAPDFLCALLDTFIMITTKVVKDRVAIAVMANHLRDLADRLDQIALPKPKAKVE